MSSVSDAYACRSEENKAKSRLMSQTKVKRKTEISRKRHATYRWSRNILQRNNLRVRDVSPPQKCLKLLILVHAIHTFTSPLKQNQEKRLRCSDPTGSILCTSCEKENIDIFVQKQTFKMWNKHEQHCPKNKNLLCNGGSSSQTKLTPPKKIKREKKRKKNRFFPTYY